MSHVREKSIQSLYNKLHELVGLLSELLNVQVLTDNAVLHASSLGVAPFFVEGVSELQLSSLRLVTTVSELLVFVSVFGPKKHPPSTSSRIL